MNNPKYSCLSCRKVLTSNNFNLHNNSASCMSDGDIVIKDKSTKCEFCNKEYRTYNGKCQHTIRCLHNPDRRPKIMPSGNTAWNKGKTADNDPRIQAQADTRNKRIKEGKIKPSVYRWTEEDKIRQSERMSAIAQTSFSYSGKYNRGNVKEIICSNGMKVLGSWESLFVEYCIAENITIEQPLLPFSYMFEGKERSYYPDFYLPEHNLYIEVKGMQTPKDLAKWDSLRNIHGKQLKVVDKIIIKSIKDGCRKGIVP